MIPVLYEFKRVLTTKTVIVLTAIIVLASLGSALSASTSISTTSFNTISYGYGFNVNNTTYKAVVYVGNNYGTPVSGSTVNLSFSPTKTFTETTDINGYANFTVQNKNNSTFQFVSGTTIADVEYNYTTSLSFEHIAYGSLPIFGLDNYSNSYFFNYTAKGYYTNTKNSSTINADSPRFQMSAVGIPNEQTRNGVQLFYDGNGSGAAPKVDLYYKPFNVSTFLPQQPGFLTLSPSNMTYYGQYSGFNSMSVNPQSVGNATQHSYEFAIFTPNGTFLASTLVTVSTALTTKQINSQFFGSEIVLIGVFLPLMAAISAYVTYGKDKTGSILESTLVRPVSRKGLLASRYLANSSAVIIAVIASLLLSSLIFLIKTGTALPLSTFLVSLWAMIVTSAAFIGLVYLASGFLKSQGALLGFALGVYFIFALFWSAFDLIPLLIASRISVGFGTLSFGKALVMLQYASPAGLTTIANYYAGGIQSLLFSVQNVTNAQLGITPLNIALVGLVWIVVPLVAALYVFIKKD